MRYLWRNARPLVCESLKCYAWYTAIGNAIAYGILAAFCIFIGAQNNSGPIGDYKYVITGFGVYFIIPFCVSIAFGIGLMKNNVTAISYWIIFTCADGIILAIAFITTGIIILQTSSKEISNYGTVIIMMGFIYYGMTYYVASIVNRLRMNYIEVQTQTDLAQRDHLSP